MHPHLKRVVDTAARAAGVRVIPSWRMSGLPQAEYLARLFALLGIDCVFDVGANNGQFRDFLRAEVGFAGQILSFEPNPDAVAVLRTRAAADSRWRIEALALGESAGTARFNIMAADQFSSFLQPDHAAVAMFAEANRVARTVSVEVRTLAELAGPLLRESGCSRPYLKLDTQGYDLPVVRGAGDALRLFSAVQSEASIKPIYRDAPDFAETIAVMAGLGYEVSAVFPNNPGHFPVMIEFDCHFIQRTCIPEGRLN